MVSLGPVWLVGFQGLAPLAWLDEAFAPEVGPLGIELCVFCGAFSVGADFGVAG